MALLAMFSAPLQPRATPPPLPVSKRAREIVAKRMIENAVKRSNHALRHIHTSRDARLDGELRTAALLLEDARRILSGRS